MFAASPRRRQGVEVPDEFSPINDDTCGQAITFTYYIRYSEETPAPSPPVPIPSPNPYDAKGGNVTFGYEQPFYSWDRLRHGSVLVC